MKAMILSHPALYPVTIAGLAGVAFVEFRRGGRAALAYLVGGQLFAVLGASLLFVLPEKLREFADYRLLLFGLLLVLMMRFRPEGLVANRRRQLEFHDDDEELADEGFIPVKGAHADRLREAINATDLGQGISVEVGEKQAAVDIDIVAEYGVSIADLATGIRRNVIAAIERMTGLEVVEVDITVHDVYIGDDEPDQPADGRLARVE